MTPLLLAIQAASASIGGTVRDGLSGAPMAGAVVALPDLDRRAVTDANGLYSFSDVPPGPQHVLVRRIGYAPRTLHALVPSRGSVAIDITLRSYPVTLDAVAARAAIPVRGLDAADSSRLPDRAISLAAIRHHPLLAEPDVFEALGGGEVATRPEAPSGLHVRGGGADQVAYLLDGIPVFNPYHSAGSFSAWNPDALTGIELRATAPGLADALSGVVAGTTRPPGAEVVMQGSVSTTHTRLTVDGPLGGRGAGFLFSRRVAFAGFPVPESEPSYLRGDAGDWMAKLEAPLFAGRVRLLGFESESEIGAAAVPPDSATVAWQRNWFTWRGSSIGGEWSRTFPGGAFSVRAWSARGAAAATWQASDSVREHLASARRDIGLAATVDLDGRRSHTTVGFRSDHSRTSYDLQAVTGQGPSREIDARTPVSALFVQHSHALTRRTAVEIGLVGAVAAGEPYLSPRAALRWAVGPAVAMRAEYGRLHQFAQSLRNPESVVGMVFPADLPLGIGAGVPVARSDQAILAAEYRPAPGMRLGAQVYVRDFEGLVLVAPHDAGPYATGFVVGSGAAGGGAVELGVNGARYGMLASYGVQRVRLEYGDSSYVPGHGAAHALDAGVMYFPSPTWSLRLGGTGLWGRRATAVRGPFEWESCNLLDRGCEFAGTPQQRSEPLGATGLPAYLRVDFGVRKHWHLRLAGRDGLVAVYGTVTNVFAHGNVLTLVADPSTGARSAVGMRPRAPLLVGIDWRF